MVPLGEELQQCLYPTPALPPTLLFSQICPWELEEQREGRAGAGPPASPWPAQRGGGGTMRSPLRAGSARKAVTQAVKAAREGERKGY